MAIEHPLPFRPYASQYLSLSLLVSSYARMNEEMYAYPG